MEEYHGEFVECLDCGWQGLLTDLIYISPDNPLCPECRSCEIEEAED